MPIVDFIGNKCSFFILLLLLLPVRVSALSNDGFHQVAPHQAVTMRWLMAPHSYGVRVVARGQAPRFAALISAMGEAACLARRKIRVDGVTLLVAPRFFARGASRGLCELWLKEEDALHFFANRLQNDHFIQIDGHDINVKNYHLDWLRISGGAQ